MDYAQLFNLLLPIVPAKYAGDATAIATFIVALCALVAKFWPRPKEGSKWLGLYTAVNKIGFNSGHALNADDAQK